MRKKYYAEIVSTGTEILQGLYPDTNAQWLSSRLGELGLPVMYHHAVRDNREAIRGVLALACRRAALVVISGGLGPTEDDLTRALAAELWGVELRRDPRALEMIRERFARGNRPLPESNLVQADIPQGALPLYNPWGTAPGFIMPPAENRAALVALPGPPRELKPIFVQQVAAWISEHFPPQEVTRRLVLRSCNRPESEINQLIRDLFSADERVQVGLRAQMGRVDIRLTASGPGPEEVDRLLRDFEKELIARIGEEDIFGRNEETLDQATARLLKESGLTVACAESCTAGHVAVLLTNVAGSSEYFNEGYITYSNQAKVRLLGVRAETLDAHGAVSPEVASEMAAGARRVSGADLGLSVTGIAGPGGGGKTKPVGLTYIGFASPEGISTERHVYAGNRAENREWAAWRAIDILRRYLLRRRPLTADPA